MVRVPDRDVNEKIVTTGDVKNTAHLSQVGHVPSERVHNVPRVSAQPDRDHRFEPDPQSVRVDITVITANHADSGQTPDPFETRRWGHTHEFRQPVIGQTSIILQNRQNSEVNSVEVV